MHIIAKLIVFASYFSTIYQTCHKNPPYTKNINYEDNVVFETTTDLYFLGLFYVSSLVPESQKEGLQKYHHEKEVRLFVLKKYPD